MLHVERGAVLGLVLRLLSIQTAVHATVAILCKKCVDGLYSGLTAGNKKGNVKTELQIRSFPKRLTYFYFGGVGGTHHDGFSLKCFYFLSQVLVGLEQKQ